MERVIASQQLRSYSVPSLKSLSSPKNTKSLFKPF